MALPFFREARWVFIGDSITYSGRLQCPEALGTGYVRFINDWLRASDPKNAPEVINAGISGNKIDDLQRRWEDDVLSKKPDLVSIKIGINDVWHGLGPERTGISVDEYRAGYIDILDRLRASAPQARIVLCEPSVIWPPAPEEGNKLLQPYIEVVRDLGAKYKVTAVVALHGAFESARAARPDIQWAPDGVHPGPSGHMLIARQWLAAMGLL